MTNQQFVKYFLFPCQIPWMFSYYMSFSCQTYSLYYADSTLQKFRLINCSSPNPATDDEISGKQQTHSHRYWRTVVATTQYLVDGVPLTITATAMSSTETDTDNDGPIRTRKRQCHVDQWKTVIAKREDIVLITILEK